MPRGGFFRRLARARNDGTNTENATDILSSADHARDSGDSATAATLYEQAILLCNNRPDLYVQLGNMLKDSGQLQKAYDAYATALDAFQSKEAGAEQGTATADVLCQLGHLFKMAGQREQAVSYYRRAYQADPKEYYLNEAKITEAVVNTLPETAKPLALRPEAVPLEEKRPFQSILDAARTMGPKYLDDVRQCVCWSRQFRRLRIRDAIGRYACRICGSEITDAVTVANTAGLEVDSSPDSITLAALSAALARVDLELRGSRIALVGAELNEPVPADILVKSLTLSNRNILGADLRRCDFDIVVMWRFAEYVSDAYRIIDQAFALANPNGLVCFVNSLPKSVSLGPEWSEVPDLLSGNSAGEHASEDSWMRLSNIALQRALRLSERGAKIYRQIADRNDLALVAIRKSPILRVAVMSGIGDSVWSLMFAKALLERYPNSLLDFVINDSGDARRKRSNGMMARFSAVHSISTQKFSVHADPAMDVATGHLRYVPSGQVPLMSDEGFDYRLIVNTYLEHGYNVEDVCLQLGLPSKLVDFDFFQGYATQEKDLRAARKVLNQAGTNYVVFYYGALIDNTDGGLNRGGLWSPADWNALGRKLHEEYGCKIVIIGASYDLEYAKLVQSQTDDLFYVNTIGQLEIAETLQVINGAKFIVSFPAGVGIVAPYMRVPSVIFWRPKDLSYHIMHERAGFEAEFSTNWVPPKVKSGGLYYSAWYGVDTPETIAAEISKQGWAKRTPSAKIGTWVV